MNLYRGLTDNLAEGRTLLDRGTERLAWLVPRQVRRIAGRTKQELLVRW